MYILMNSFDADMAVSRVSEILALADHPDRIAEKLDLPSDEEQIRNGVPAGAFKTLVAEVEKIKRFADLDKEIEESRAGRWAFSFMGKAATDKHVKKLEEARRKLGAIIEAPRWFYKQERYWLLAAIRDYALDHAQGRDAEWVDTDQHPIPHVLTDMFEAGDFAKAKAIGAQLDKPLKDIPPRWILETLEGHRALHFDFNEKVVYYYHPVRRQE